MDKQALRQYVWDELTRSKQAGFPMPVHGRIPGFVGAPAAAARLRALPEWVPPRRERYATSIKGLSEYGREVPLEQVERIGLVVAGSVAVDAHGGRAGKGEGYSDREYAILREMGHPDMPIATTVHDLQMVAHVPRDPFDIPLDIVCTPTRTLRTETAYPKPPGIDWSRVTAAELAAMPPLRDLLARRRAPGDGGSAGAPDGARERP